MTAVSPTADRPIRVRLPLLLAFAGFVLLGVISASAGVLLPAQMSDYGVDRATIGITFFMVSAGFVIAGLASGALISRLGLRMTLITGGAAYALSGLCLAIRPPFAVFVAVQVLVGYGTGILETVLQAYIAPRPGATTLLNRLHAFWGVGALTGPVLASWLLGFTSWRAVLLVLALVFVPLTAAFALFPRGLSTHGAERPVVPLPGPGTRSREPARNLLGAGLRDRGVLAGAVMLSVYVGLEIGVGNWAYSYLVQGRGLGGTLAGYSVSGYWLGLTAGRFLISPLAQWAGLTTTRMMYGCLAGITAASALAWLAPEAAAASAALVLLGFFLGPVFPTTMSVTPAFTAPELVPTAIGVMNAGSVIGGSALPWLAGVIGQEAGLWTLLPYAIVLALFQFAAWRPLAARIRSAGTTRRELRRLGSPPERLALSYVVRNFMCQDTG
ncbi:MAG TPA: MFS transporter [Trebonia sp.]